MQPPWVRLFGSDLLILIVGHAFHAVIEIPSVVGQLIGVIAEGIRGRGPSPAGVFPLRFGGQAIEMPRLRAQPLAIFKGRMLGHRNGRESILPHAKTHLHIGRRRTGNNINGLVRWCRRLFSPIFITVDRRHLKRQIFVPGHFMPPHPK